MAEQVTYKCMRCGNTWRGEYDVESIERMCPRCRSNSVRRIQEPTTTSPSREGEKR